MTFEESFSLNDGLTRQNYARDLKVAIREALVNTLMHAYYDTKQSIKIVNCEDFIEFYNPGNMRINKEDFIHGGHSKDRNSILLTLSEGSDIQKKLDLEDQGYSM